MITTGVINYRITAVISKDDNSFVPVSSRVSTFFCLSSDDNRFLCCAFRRLIKILLRVFKMELASYLHELIKVLLLFLKAFH